MLRASIIAVAAATSHADVCSLYAIEGPLCGQSDLDCKFASYAKAFMKKLMAGTCASQGYTVVNSTTTKSVPIIGDIKITEYTKPPAVTLEAEPCCQHMCKDPAEAKYYSLAKSLLGTRHCGECCMDPRQYPLYHHFEANLTKADNDSPCKTFGYTKYDSTVTHGFWKVKMTLDLYDLPEEQDVIV